MKIAKLTITPTERDYPRIIRRFPEVTEAEELIRKRLIAGYKIYNDSNIKSVKDLPKCLRNWVNPNTHVLKYDVPEENHRIFTLH
ncbi:hypothetical protein IKP85_01230 [bacterium]|nr:hypothetical protein [bacterium]